MELTPNDIADLRIQADKLQTPVFRDLLDAYEDLQAAQDRIQELEYLEEDAADNAREVRELREEVRELKRQNAALTKRLESVR